MTSTTESKLQSAWNFSYLRSKWCAFVLGLVAFPILLHPMFRLLPWSRPSGDYEIAMGRLIGSLLDGTIHHRKYTGLEGVERVYKARLWLEEEYEVHFDDVFFGIEMYRVTFRNGATRSMPAASGS